MKSDAFTIHEDDLTRVMGKTNHFIKSYQTGILNFEEGIGNWRPTNNEFLFWFWQSVIGTRVFVLVLAVCDRDK